MTQVHSSQQGLSKHRMVIRHTAGHTHPFLFQTMAHAGVIARSKGFTSQGIATLFLLGVGPKEEVPIPNGYHIDALVEVNGEKVGIEVDGQYHFMNREPTGSTLLKRRLVFLFLKAMVMHYYWIGLLKHTLVSYHLEYHMCSQISGSHI
jgi:hypothetical protein